MTIFDVGEEPETPRSLYCDGVCCGTSLDKLLARDDHRLPLETALKLTHELAEALDCAHAQGVVHRDLKPANILITEDGHAKIADFGVAKLNLANFTLAGRVLGTPAYMSPEQLNGDGVDGRSDLFSLGVILYTILTGYRPFQGNSALTVCFKVVNRLPVAATVLNTDLPPVLDYIIARALAKDPAQRYQRGTEMAQRHRGCAKDESLRARPRQNCQVCPRAEAHPKRLPLNPSQARTLCSRGTAHRRSCWSRSGRGRLPASWYWPDFSSLGSGPFHLAPKECDRAPPSVCH